MSAIKIENMSKKFGWFLSRKKIVALDNLSLEVPENMIFGFLGPNGAGKTTAIKILLGLINADKGTSQIFGKDSGDREIRERIGFLPESPRFYPHMTAEDFLHFTGKLIHLGAMERARRTDELLERVGLKEAASQKMEGFSRGQLQRVGIAQALMSDPDLLILDEPITGLDPMGRRDVKSLLAGLKDEGKTIFFSSHVLSDVEQMCDRIGILNHGRLIERGEISELLGETGLEIWAENLSSEVLPKVEELCSSVVMKGGRMGFQLQNVSKKQQVIDLIEKNNGKVREIISQKEELEEFFLRRVQEDNKKRAASKGEAT